MRKFVLLVFVAQIVTTMQLTSIDAEASYRSFSAYSCVPSSEVSATYNFSVSFGSSFYGDNGQVIGTDTAFDMILLCPVVNDSTISTTASTVGLTAYGYYNGGNHQACTGSPPETTDLTLEACRAYFNGGGGTCGIAATYSNSSAGVFSQSLDMSVWTASGAHSQDGYFLTAQLGCSTSSGSDNVLWSYEMTN